jgi:hypothetical protein
MSTSHYSKTLFNTNLTCIFLSVRAKLKKKKKNPETLYIIKYILQIRLQSLNGCSFIRRFQKPQTHLTKFFQVQTFSNLRFQACVFRRNGCLNKFLRKIKVLSSLRTLTYFKNSFSCLQNFCRSFFNVQI